MLTRLKVTGFKNLVDVDLHFGPFTCIAGQNGVGKSNLFDAIQFLSALADRTFMDAAKSVRDESGRTGDIRALFHRTGDRVGDRMRFEAEMIIQPTGADDLGQTASAGSTFLQYSIELGYRANTNGPSGEALELIHENLTYLPPVEWQKRLKFPRTDKWDESALVYKNRKSPYISTQVDEGERRVLLHREEARTSGKTTKRPARQLPRTVLSATNAYESPTALLVRREMQSWRLLQLEPSALRKPDEFDAPSQLGWDGAHLPATLFRLAKAAERSDATGEGASRVYGRLAARLHELIDDIRTLRIDRDDKRELLSLIATDRLGTALPARGLSDGTLRFLALAVLEMDPEAVGVVCFEEPENGIHPARIPAMLRLLKDIAVDPSLPVGPDNPLRQVIVNTHSPVVVKEVYENDLVGAVTEEAVTSDGRARQIGFHSLQNTWRATLDPPPQQLALNALQAYLAPLRRRVDGRATNSRRAGGKARRVCEREDVRSLFDGLADA